MQPKRDGTTEPTCKMILGSQNHIEISKIYQGSSDFRAGDGTDFLAATGAESPRPSLLRCSVR
jgi:hypothetical protein